ncbi:hypothetical protein HYALB_00007858 [Hymenoscyphus albidus]|uniref:FAD-binding PCMH-type domain-containing protein n=1 Tax=Hymenoscyphus albidus TaxID=595503 RepID=A0A9N9LCX9_9HELO|nr:hypothetical protein HYALB_00007858 [Hymenoscyphus albidus]
MQHVSYISLLASFLASVEAGPYFSNGLYQPSAVTNCLDAKKVPYAIDGSANWTALTTPYNLRLAYKPAVVTIPETAEQVGFSITCAAMSNLKVQPKGGGHSYASFSSGGQDGSVIVDMEKFSSITVDQTTFVAKVGAGQRLGNVATAIYEQGKRALPHGTCPGVGIAGHAIHGGYGYASRKWGLTLDHIVGLDVVLANGTQVHATSDSNADLFFAMRGAGDSFGIATHLYLATEAAPETVLTFAVPLSSDINDVDTRVAGFQAMQDYTLNSGKITGDITFGVYLDTYGGMSLSGWCMSCDRTTLDSEIIPGLVSGFNNPAATTTSSNWIDVVTAIAAPAPLAQPLGSAYSSHDTFLAKSVTTREALPLTTEAWRSFFETVKANQGQWERPWFSIINLYGGPGSAINKPTTSAYSDRDSLWVFQNYGYSSNSQPPFDPAGATVVNDLQNALPKAMPEGEFTAYLNYLDPEMSPQLAAEKYYGKETYNKLLGLKMVYDPLFTFWNPQAVGNSMAL